MRDFFSSGIAFLITGEPEMVKNFLLMAVQLQGNEKQVDCFTLGEGVMPASFKVQNFESILLHYVKYVHSKKI